MVWLHHKKAVHLHHKGCTQGGALVSSAPTNQRIAPTALLVQLRQLHPLRCTNQAENTPTITNKNKPNIQHGKVQENSPQAQRREPHGQAELRYRPGTSGRIRRAD